MKLLLILPILTLSLSAKADENFSGTWRGESYDFSYRESSGNFFGEAGEIRTDFYILWKTPCRYRCEVPCARL